jgi:hypothetical protein
VTLTHASAREDSAHHCQTGRVLSPVSGSGPRGGSYGQARAPDRAALLVAAVIAVSPAAVGKKPTTLQLLDVAAPIDTFLDLGAPGPSTGDTEVFRDTLVWADDRSAAGKAEGKCTLIEFATRQFECTIVTTLAGGTITTEGIGVLAPDATSTAAVTGGTGEYEDAGGHATLVFHPGGGPSLVTFSLTG